jgi:hypothetical protein
VADEQDPHRRGRGSPISRRGGCWRSARRRRPPPAAASGG